MQVAVKLAYRIIALDTCSTFGTISFSFLSRFFENVKVASSEEIMMNNEASAKCTPGHFLIQFRMRTRINESEM